MSKQTNLQSPSYRAAKRGLIGSFILFGMAMSVLLAILEVTALSIVIFVVTILTYLLFGGE